MPVDSIGYYKQKMSKILTYSGHLNLDSVMVKDSILPLLSHVFSVQILQFSSLNTKYGP
jgi:hypothetical protein